MKKNQNLSAMNAGRMTSLEIAAVIGKQHKNVMQAIRNMEPAWEQERGLKFQLTQIREEIPNGGYRLRPVFVLSKTECLYIATKFNDVARAKLVLRWEELETRGHRESWGQVHDSGQNQATLDSHLPAPVAPKQILAIGDAIRRQQIGEENAPADGCLTVKEIAKMLDISIKELNKILVEEGVQFWNGCRYKLTPQYAERGLAQDRAFHYYSLDGEKKERAYLVWTPIGMEFIRTIV